LIEKYYSETSPDDYVIEHYENIFFSELKEIKPQFKDLYLIKFSVFYHDLIYKPTSKYIEEKVQNLKFLV
jgi:hypothetical protein